MIAGAGDRSILQRVDEARIPLPLLARVFLGGYFIYTGVVKTLDPVAFLKGVRLYEMLPESPPVFLNGTAVVLPWLEIICGIALVLGLFRRGAAAVVALMLCVFSPAIFSRALAVASTEGISFFQVTFDCGCGTGHEIIWIKLCKNAGLLILSIWAIATRCRTLCVDALFERRGAAAIDTGAGPLPGTDAVVGGLTEQSSRPPVSVGVAKGAGLSE